MDRVRTIAGPAGRRVAIAETGADEVTVVDAATVVVRAARGVSSCNPPQAAIPAWRQAALEKHSHGRQAD